jgi:hypothetical protein
MVPVLQIDSNGWGRVTAEAWNEQAEPYVDAFNRLSDLEANGYHYEVFERYLRIFHGATKVDSYNLGTSREYGYVGFDTAAWREAVGVGPDFAREDILEEVRAWSEGDVYGVIVEKRLRTRTEYIDPLTEEVTNVDEDEEWVEVEDGAVWGYYGHRWAEEAAREALKDYTEE